MEGLSQVWCRKLYVYRLIYSIQTPHKYYYHTHFTFKVAAALSGGGCLFSSVFVPTPTKN